MQATVCIRSRSSAQTKISAASDKRTRILVYTDTMASTAARNTQANARAFDSTLSDPLEQLKWLDERRGTVEAHFRHTLLRLQADALASTLREHEERFRCCMRQRNSGNQADNLSTLLISRVSQQTGESNATNVAAGQVLRLVVCQDGTGSRTVTAWDSSILWSGGTAPTLTTTASKCDAISFIGATKSGTVKAFGTTVLNF